MSKLPKYWRYETSGVLRRAIEAYLSGGPMSDEQVAAMRNYLRQWIEAPYWLRAETLRSRVDGLTNREAITGWLNDAVELGIDPL